MVTFKNEWNIFKWDKQQQQINKQTNKKNDMRQLFSNYISVKVKMKISEIGGLACEDELKND